MKEKNPEESREVESQLVEFDAWCQKHNSRDLQAFARDRQLAPDVVEDLNRYQQMEKELSIIVDGDNKVASSKLEGDNLIEQTFDKYRLQKKLGAGGMGTVWLAHQSDIKRKVAIKLIRADRASAVATRRFAREKQALASMSHINVAQVYDTGTTEDNRQYIAMEFVDGVSIVDYCRNHHSSLSVRLELFLQLCSAIQHAHQLGLLHRDIKPDNILVTEANGKPLVKVIDFGLVRPSDTWDPQITEPDMIVGSPLWMSPEQAGGARGAESNDESQKPLDTRTDVFSLGVILYQLLTDTTPISKEYFERATKFEILQKIHNEIPELPSERVNKSRFVEGNSSTPVSSWGKVLRSELDWVTMKSLEKKCDRRYPTVAAFAEDIKNYLQNEPVTARPPSFLYRLKKLTQRHKLETFATVATFGLVVMTSVLLIWLTHEAFAQAALARTAEAQKSRVIQLTAKMLDNNDPSVNGVRFTESQLKLLDEIRTEIDQDGYWNDPLLEAEFRQFLASSYSGSGEYASSVAQSEKVIDIFKHARDVNPRQLIAAKLQLAQEHSLHRAEAKAKPLAEECLKRSLKLFGENDQLTIAARTAANKSSLHLGERSRDEIIAELEKTADLARSVLGENNPTTVNAMTAIGVAYILARRHADAAKQFEMTLGVAREVYGSNDRRTMDLRIRNLQVQSRLGGTTFGIEDDLRKLLIEAKEKFGDNHLFTILLRHKKAHLDLAAGSFDSVEKQLRQLIHDSSENLGESNLITLEVRNDLGRVYRRKARFARSDKKRSLLDKAAKIFFELIDDYKELGLSNSKFDVKVWTDLARVKFMRSDQGSWKEALGIVERVCPVAEELLGLDSQTTRILLDTRCKCLFRMGRQEEAIESGIQSYEKSLTALAQPSEVTAGWAGFVADASILVGRRKAALKYYGLAISIIRELQGESGKSAIFVLAALCNEQAYAGDYKSAEMNARKLIKHMPERISARSQMLLEAQVTIGESLCEQGAFEEAKAILNKASVPSGSQDVRLFELRALSALGLCAEAEGNGNDAVAMLRKAKAGLKEIAAGIAPRHAWYAERCDQRLAKLENVVKPNIVDE